MNALRQMLARRRMRRHPGTDRLITDLKHSAAAADTAAAGETPREEQGNA